MLSQAPKVGERLMKEIRSDLRRYVDVQFLAVTTQIRNKDKLNDLLRSLSTDATAFVRRSGICFGFGIGLVEMVPRWASSTSRGSCRRSASASSATTSRSTCPSGRSNPRATSAVHLTGEQWRQTRLPDL
ncbi:hypothetical protein [Nocardioides pelophilus]|uniref:hypothetical protein n=1 Tax=Nocardioides pelophilus TaxID=2172019 RepID=UPI0016045AB6|nr:hypothetical protein [Nocardioides pelophilus]